jgi:hypothetical protein
VKGEFPRRAHSATCLEWYELQKKETRGELAAREHVAFIWALRGAHVGTPGFMPCWVSPRLAYGFGSTRDRGEQGRGAVDQLDAADEARSTCRWARCACHHH